MAGDPAVAAEVDRRIRQLLDHPVVGGFDLAHLRAIHRRLFDGLVPDAGELRTGEPPATTARSADPGDAGVRPADIQYAANKVLGALGRQGLRGVSRDTMLHVLAEVYLDLLALRPFNHGTDAAVRVFVTHLAVDAGYRLDWTARPTEDLAAAIDAAHEAGDHSALAAVLDASLTADPSQPPPRHRAGPTRLDTALRDLTVRLPPPDRDDTKPP